MTNVATVLTNIATSGSTETAIVSALIPANTMTVGAVYDFTVYGTQTSSNGGGTANLHIGTTSVTGGIDPANVTITTTNTAGSFAIDAMLTTRSIGSGTSASAVGGIRVPVIGISVSGASTSALTFNSTVNKYVELTLIGTTASVFTASNGAIEQSI